MADKSVEDDQMPPSQTKESEEKQISDELEAILATLPKSKGWVNPFMYQYKGVWMDPPRLASVLWLEQHFTSHPSDLLLVTCPKVGTTWLKALAFAITKRHYYTFDDPHHPLLNHFPHYVVPTLEFNGIDGIKESNSTCTNMNRIFHTHLHYNMLGNALEGSKCRVVYLCRDPGDTFVSLWKFTKELRSKEVGDLPLEEAFEMFCNGASAFGPYWDHVLGYWKASQEGALDKFLFVTYEELHRDQTQQVKRLAEFLGFPFSEEEEKEGAVDQIIKQCSFDKLSNLEVNKTGTAIGFFAHDLFFRKGRVGDAKKYLTEEMVKRLNSITEEKFRGCGLEHMIFDTKQSG